MTIKLSGDESGDKACIILLACDYTRRFSASSQHDAPRFRNIVDRVCVATCVDGQPDVDAVRDIGFFMCVVDDEMMLVFHEKQIWINFKWTREFITSAADKAYGCVSNVPGVGDAYNEDEILFMAFNDLRRKLDAGLCVGHPAMFLHWFILTAKPKHVEVTDE